MESIQLLLVSEKDEKQGQFFQEYFHSFPNVTVTRNPLEDGETTIDCLCIPMPSSFGSPMGDFTALHYYSKLNDKTRDSIAKYILRNFYGEQSPGSAFIVRNRSKDPKFKYVAIVSLARLPELSTADFAYTCMRALLLEIIRFNSEQSKAGTTASSQIETVMIPSFAYGHFASSLDEKKRITRLMALAYRNMFYPIRHLPSIEEARILTTQIYEKVTNSPQERRAKTKEMLLSGELEKRGLYDEEELNCLIELVANEGELREIAAKALCKLLHSQPSEFCISHETMCSAIARSKDALQYLLDEAERGHLSIFRVIKPSEIEFGSEIGNGTEAQVFRAKWNGLNVAVKKFKGIPNPKEFQRELGIMSLVHHPNLTRCYGGYSDSTKDIYFLVMDLMDIDVYNVLHNPSDTWRMTYERQLKIALHMARGLEYLHSCNLIHRDLKSVNLLLDKDFNAKVCDFGLSRVVAQKKGNMTGNVGTVSWIAPEVFENQPYDAKADVYSFGIVLWELHTKQTPFADISAFEIPMAVSKGDRPPIPKDMPKDYAKLMKACWSKKPSKRPDFTKIVKELTRMYKAVGSEPETPPTSTSSTPTLLSKILPGMKRSDSVPPASGSKLKGISLSASTPSLPHTESSEESSSTNDTDNEDAGARSRSGATALGASGDVTNSVEKDIKSQPNTPTKQSRAAALLAMGDTQVSPVQRRRSHSSSVIANSISKGKTTSKRNLDKPDERQAGGDSKAKRRGSSTFLHEDERSATDSKASE